MKLAPYYFPVVDGPWGVDEAGGFWYVTNGKRARKIGPVVGISKRPRPNYFDRAMEEALRRNQEIAKC